MIRKVDHLYVESRQFEAAQSFWVTLGFRVAESWGDEKEHRACKLISGETEVVLATGSDKQATVHFEVLDASAAAAQLEAAGATIVTPLEPTHWGTRWLRVADPDGNIYALEERPSSTPG